VNRDTEFNTPDGRAENRVPDLKRNVLSEEIKRYLVDSILNGEYQAGERLVETRLARELGVSQAPVREAIKELEHMGLVESKPYKGAYVKKFTPRELEEVYSVRALIEGAGAREAVLKLGGEGREALRRLIGEMEMAAARGDRRAMIQSDMEFHRIIMEAAGNRLLYRIWNNIHLANSTFVTTKVSEKNLQELARRHWDVLKALETGDPDRAEEAMRAHILGLT